MKKKEYLEDQDPSSDPRSFKSHVNSRFHHQLSESAGESNFTACFGFGNVMNPCRTDLAVLRLQGLFFAFSILSFAQ